ncbi:unnamed protein product [Agarophyton chilense]
MNSLPAFSVTSAQYNRALRRVESYIATTRTDVDARPRAHAIYSFHQPGKRVHGTVIIFHGLASSPELMRPFVTYLHQNGFNVYAPPGAGHAFHYSRLPHTLMSSEFGAQIAASVINQNPALKQYFDRITQLAVMTPPNASEFKEITDLIITLLKKELSPQQFTGVMSALQLLSGTDCPADLEAQVAKYCESDHYRYESHPIERYCDVASLPGPVSVIGYSLGTVQAMNLAARVPAVEKLVVLAPLVHFFGYDTEPLPSFSLSALGALDLHLFPFDISTVSARHVTATTLAARVIQRDQITQPIRQRVATFVIVSDSDNACDPQSALEFCQEKLSNKRTVSFSYPKAVDLKHGVHPHSENKYSVPLLQEVFRFLTTEQVRIQNMLCREGDSSLPPVDPKSLKLCL